MVPAGTLRGRAICGARGPSTARRRPSSRSIARTSRRAATSSRPTRGRCSPTRMARARRRVASSTGWTSRAPAIRLARTAAAEDTDRPRAVAFSVSDEAESLGRAGTARLLARIFEDEPPDLILLETLSLIREPDTFDLVASLVELGLPLWLSYRRCRHGVCGVYGQHWGPPEGDLFGRAATRFEEMGVAALLINCLPVDHVPGMIELAARLHRHAARRLPEPRPPHARAVALRRPHRPGGVRAARARVARGGGADHRRLLRRDPGAHRRRRSRARGNARGPPAGRSSCRHRRRRPAGRGRRVARRPRGARSIRSRFPISPSSPASSFRRRGATCSGSTCNAPGSEPAARASTSVAAAGSSPSSSALNGAASVHAIDIDRGSVANTLANAFRNDVAELVTGETIDLFQWEPTERFDVIAASLYQMPVDPYEEPSGHRPLDFWGRNLFDRFLGLLPDLLAPGRQGARPPALDPRPGEDGSAPRGPRAHGARRRLQLLPVRRGLRDQRGADRAGRGALGCPSPRGRRRQRDDRLPPRDRAGGGSPARRSAGRGSRTPRSRRRLQASRRAPPRAA